MDVDGSEIDDSASTIVISEFSSTGQEIRYAISVVQQVIAASLLKKMNYSDTEVVLTCPINGCFQPITLDKRSYWSHLSTHISSMERNSSGEFCCDVLDCRCGSSRIRRESCLNGEHPSHTKDIIQHIWDNHLVSSSICSLVCIATSDTTLISMLGSCMAMREVWYACVHNGTISGQAPTIRLPIAAAKT
jgi:hypothetical protein